MFNQTDENESDFCESYKSQILNNDVDQAKDSSLSILIKLLTIVILLAIIIGVSFYGYSYFSNRDKINKVDTPPVSIQTFDEDLVVTLDENEEQEEKEKIKEEIPVSTTLPTHQVEQETVVETIQEVVKDEPKIEKISMPTIITPQVEDDVVDEINEIDKIANSVKIAIAQSEEKENKIEEKIEKEATHPNIKKEESLEVPSPSSNAKYLEDLAKLSKEIDKDRN